MGHSRKRRKGHREKAGHSTPAAKGLPSLFPRHKLGISLPDSQFQLLSTGEGRRRENERLNAKLFFFFGHVADTFPIGDSVVQVGFRAEGKEELPKEQFDYGCSEKS